MSLVDKNGLKVNSELVDFINNEAIPGTGVEPDDFWSKFENVVHELTPINKDLLKKRESIQKKIDDWHKNNKNDNWATFYAETRLYYFLNILNKKNLIDLKSSKKIEKIILK